MKLAFLAASMVTLSACAPALAPVASARHDVTRPPVERPSAPVDRVRLRIASHASAMSHVVVELTLEGAARDRPLRFEPAHGATLARIEARDDRGVDAILAPSEGSSRPLTLERPPIGVLAIRYEVALSEPDTRARADATAPSSEPTDLRVCGEDVSILAPSDEAIELDLTLATGGGEGRAASSFAVGSGAHVRTTPTELRRACFLAGDVGHAVFHVNDGDDLAAFDGYTSFDPRFVAAEIAATRSGIDEALGLSPGSSSGSFGVLLTSSRHPTVPFDIARRARGLVVSVDPGAAWTSAARLDVAQKLAQRYVGGRLWVGDRAHEASGQFFSEGFSRGIARDVLFDLGLFSHADRAAELNGLLAIVALSPLGHATLDELSRDGSKEAVRVSTARGALATAWLDEVLPSHGGGAKGDVATLTRELLRDAVAKGRDSVSLDELVGAVRARGGDELARTFEAIVVRGVDVPFSGHTLGRCYRWAPRQVAPFELGLELDGLAVRRVIAGTRAAASGVEAFAELTSIEYRDGRSDVPVRLTVGHGESARTLTYLPAGKSVRTRLFERDSRVADDVCERGE